MANKEKKNKGAEIVKAIKEKIVASHGIQAKIMPDRCDYRSDVANEKYIQDILERD